MFIPGMVVGICGALCMVASIIMAYHEGHNVLGHLLLGCGIASIPVLLIIWYKVFTRTFSIQEDERGFSSSNKSSKDLLSAEGTTATTLHPSGIILIDGKRIDVVSSGEMIAKGSRVKVVEVEGNRVVVRKVKNG